MTVGSRPYDAAQRLQRLIEATKNVAASGWIYAIPVIAVLWTIAILIYSVQLPASVMWTTFVTATLIGSCSFLIGGLVGFLFGIPRAITSAAKPVGGSRYEANTNLEQVSDWLTKIIVGVGLVQIGRIIPGLARLAQSMKTPLGGQPSSAAFGLALTIANVLLGFFLFYLWSRSLLRKELEDDDDASSATQQGQ
jgi:hypothetical protein